jgi:hypothetical protein
MNMKRLIALAFCLLAVSLACQAVQRINPLTVPEESATPTIAEATTTATVVPSETPTPELSATPTVTRVAPTPIACNDDSCLDACLERINQELASSPLAAVGGDYTASSARFNLVTYDVSGDKLGKPDILWVPAVYKAYQEDLSSHLRVWDYFTAIFPAEQRKWITKYTIFTDGESNILAWVRENDQTDNSRWELGVDILDSTNPVYLTTTLTHEMAHLLTLNSEQMIQKDNYVYSPYQNKAVCPQFMSSEGCSTRQSYINQFYQKYWLLIYDDWLETVYNVDSSNEEESINALRNFASKYPDDFAALYAATSIKEDMAVSFEYFVLKPKATGTGISAKKMRFFYDFPELVTLRQQMIQSMCSYVQ